MITDRSVITRGFNRGGSLNGRSGRGGIFRTGAAPSARVTFLVFFFFLLLMLLLSRAGRGIDAGAARNRCAQFETSTHQSADWRFGNVALFALVRSAAFASYLFLFLFFIICSNSKRFLLDFLFFSRLSSL